MMIGLFFGSFNPIHQGHLMVLRYWLNETPLHQIWLIVSPQNPHKSPEDLAPAQDRLVMTQLAIQSESRLHASDIEFFLPRPSYTIDTLRHLQTQYPTYEWCLLLGADTFATLPTWKEGSTLLSHYTLWIYPRGEYVPTHLPQNALFFSRAPRIDISATQVRTYLKNRKSIRFLVPEAVESYIYQRGLYGAVETT
jgi:nicotinate-nucleotide adenylyltransferase